jgi:hypothetical protein
MNKRDTQATVAVVVMTLFMVWLAFMLEPVPKPRLCQEFMRSHIVAYEQCDKKDNCKITLRELRDYNDYLEICKSPE